MKGTALKIRAKGYLDKFIAGYRVYIIANRKDEHGNNIVLHQSWHSDFEDAQQTYNEESAEFEMVAEYSNCLGYRASFFPK